MTEHSLFCDFQTFDNVRSGRLRLTVNLEPGTYKSGDLLVLNRLAPSSHPPSSQRILYTVTQIDLEAGYCILGTPRDSSPKYHYMRCDAQPFVDVWQGRKSFEIRLNDREFQVGDVLILQQTEGSPENPDARHRYTGCYVQRKIGYILTGYGLAEGYCALGLEPLDPLC